MHPVVGGASWLCYRCGSWTLRWGRYSGPNTVVECGGLPPLWIAQPWFRTLERRPRPRARAWDRGGKLPLTKAAASRRTPKHSPLKRWALLSFVNQTDTEVFLRNPRLRSLSLACLSRLLFAP